MRRIFFASMMLIIASIFTGCDPAANTGNKPANNANTAPAVNTAAIEADIKKMVTEMAAAMTRNDVAFAEKTFSDNYIFVGPDGAVATKAERVASMKSGDTKFESVAYDEINVRVNTEGTGAVVIGRATVKGKVLGKARDGQFRMTQVWSKTKDGWRLASGQTTPITAAAPAKTDVKAKADDKKADPADAAPAANK